MWSKKVPTKTNFCKIQLQKWDDLFCQDVDNAVGLRTNLYFFWFPIFILKTYLINMSLVIIYIVDNFSHVPKTYEYRILQVTSRANFVESVSRYRPKCFSCHVRPKIFGRKLFFDENFLRIEKLPGTKFFLSFCARCYNYEVGNLEVNLLSNFQVSKKSSNTSQIREKTILTQNNSLTISNYGNRYK